MNGLHNGAVTAQDKPMQFPRYLGRVWTFTFRRFALRTDAMQIIAASLVPLVAPYLGIQNPSQANSEMLAYIGMAVLALVVIRLLTAPYFIWKEDQQAIVDLQDQLDEPERKERNTLGEHRTALRVELSNQLAKLITIAERCQSLESLNAAYEHRPNILADTMTRIEDIVSQLSYDVLLRVSILNIKALCAKIIREGAAKNDVSALLERLWRQRKLTFRIIHRDDQVHQIVSWAEFENMIEEYGESVSPDDATDGSAVDAQHLLEGIKKMVKEHGPELAQMGRMTLIPDKAKGRGTNRL